MKIQCDVCEKAEAEVLCCADEAVLCKLCDANVHAANKLSQKHQRLFLVKHPSSSSAHLPRCERCQERKGYMFCLEDRALLCRQCDISNHTAATPCVLSHQRFLISGVKVALDDSSTENSTDTTTFSGNSTRNHNHPCSRLSMPIDNNTATASFGHFPAVRESMTAAITSFDLEAANSTDVTFPSELPSFAAAEPTDWPLDEIYGTHDFNFYDFSEVGSSRIDGL